jgi:hypothetical protein
MCATHGSANIEVTTSTISTSGARSRLLSRSETILMRHKKPAKCIGGRRRVASRRLSRRVTHEAVSLVA